MKDFREEEKTREVQKEQGRRLMALDAGISCSYKTAAQSIHTFRSFHSHDGYELLLLLDGEIHFYWDGGGRKLTHGDLACVAPYVFHGAVLKTPGCYNRICINIKESLLPELSSSQTSLIPLFSGRTQGEPGWQCFSEEELRELVLLSGQLEEALKGERWGDDLLSKALLTQMLLYTGRHRGIADAPVWPSVLPDIVLRTFDYINSHLTEEISLDALAADVCHDPAYMGRCFKKITGTTILQYIILKRVNLAQQYLREGRSLNDACYLSGFQNYSHFCRTFRSHTGVSPRQYQTEWKKLSFGPR